MQKIEPHFNKKQKQALRILLGDGIVTELVYGGSAGGGKTYLGCAWLLIQSINYSGSRWAICRTSITDLMKTSKVTMDVVLKDFGLKQGIDYVYNGLEKHWTLKNGSVILIQKVPYLPSDEDYNYLGGLEVSGAFFDEVPQATSKAVEILKSRIRWKLDEFKIKGKLLMTCNPSKGFVYDNFYKPKRENKLLAYRDFIEARVEDNDRVSDSYKESLSQLTGLNKERLYLGNWDYSSELTLFNYNHLQNCFDLPSAKKTENDRYFLSCDLARLGKDQTIFVIGNHRREIVEIITMEKSRGFEIVKKIKELQKKYDIYEEDIAIDSDGVGGYIADEFMLSIHVVNNSKALEGENYINLKTQLYFVASNLVNEEKINFSAVVDKKEIIVQEFEKVEQTKVDQDGKIQMTSKTEIKRILGRSPDYSDAIAYLCVFYREDQKGKEVEFFNY